MAPITSLLVVCLLSVNVALAHPGHDVSEEAVERSAFLKRSPNSVRSCAAALRARGHFDDAINRRKTTARAIRAKRSLPTSDHFVRRDFSEYDFSHKSNLSVTWNSSESLLFSDNSSCVLQPEVTQGPYYVDGELIRKDITDDQAGVPLYLDIQIIDTSDCSPVPEVYMDLWHCNSTGVYSGVVASGNGDGDSSNINATFLRGIQATDDNGVAQFETIFPGHYTGRATHIHVMTHNKNSTQVLANNTILGSNATTHASHVGQIFFDQDLISFVAETAPYSSNTATITENSEDSILGQETDTTDPFVEYVLLGEDVSDGIFAWISLGIDPSTDEDVTSAATHYENGGVANSNNNFMSGGMGGAPGGSGNASANGTLMGAPSGTGSTSVTNTASATSSTSLTVSTGGVQSLKSSVGRLLSATCVSTLLGAVFTM